MKRGKPPESSDAQQIQRLASIYRTLTLIWTESGDCQVNGRSLSGIDGLCQTAVEEAVKFGKEQLNQGGMAGDGLLHGQGDTSS